MTFFHRTMHKLYALFDILNNYCELGDITKTTEGKKDLQKQVAEAANDFKKEVEAREKVLRDAYKTIEDISKHEGELKDAFAGAFEKLSEVSAITDPKKLCVAGHYESEPKLIRVELDKAVDALHHTRKTLERIDKDHHLLQEEDEEIES